MMIVIRACTTALLLSLCCQPCYACWSWNPFCDPAEEVAKGAEKAGEKAGEKIAEGMQSTFNPLMLMLMWTHTGTDKQKEDAKKFIEGAFGIKGTGPIPQFQVTFTFEFKNAAKAPKPLYAALLRDGEKLTDDKLKQVVLAAERQDVNFQPIQRPSIPRSDVQTYESDISKIRSTVLGEARSLYSISRDLNCDPTPPRSGDDLGGLCRKNYEEAANRLTNTIMSLVYQDAPPARRAAQWHFSMDRR